MMVEVARMKDVQGEYTQCQSCEISTIIVYLLHSCFCIHTYTIQVVMILSDSLVVLSMEGWWWLFVYCKYKMFYFDSDWL